ncbi:putative cation-transporting ATPase 1 [Tilletia horrida]|nr:putative cation-transporting ATPase 1 [Tilletia horrida]
MSGGRSKPARSNEHSADGGLLQSPYRQVSSAGHGTPARASQAPIEDSGESEESEIDLSPISADRRASLAARYSASPSKFNGLGTSLDGPTSPVLGRNGNSAQLRAGGLVTEDEDVVGGTDGEDEEGPGAALNADSENTDDEDEDGPPVEESTSLAKSKALEARQKAADARKEQSLKRKRSAAAKASRKAASQKESTADSEAAQEADEEDASEVEAMDDTARAEEPPASKKGRLDPALFAEAFSKKSSAAPPPTKMLTRQGSSERQRQTRSSTAAKSKSLVKGRDGQPMKRLPDGRTVVRAIRTTLTPSTSSKAADEDSEPIEQPDVNLSRPNAKARAFTKKALGFRPSDVADSKKDNKKDKKDKDKPKKPVRTEDDPLGLEDPLFMNLDGKGKKGKTTKTDNQISFVVNHAAVTVIDRAIATGAEPATSAAMGKIIPVDSDEIAKLSLHRRIPTEFHLYAYPFLSLYPVWFYAYMLKYDDWVKSEEWTFVYTVLLVTSHALSFLVTRWSVTAKALITCTNSKSIEDAEVARIIPHAHKGDGELVPIKRSRIEGSGEIEISFTYQADKYIYCLPDPSAPVTGVTRSPLIKVPTFRRLPYPADSRPSLEVFQRSRGLDSDRAVTTTLGVYGPNTFDIPKPKFLDLFIEHAVAPFFVFQVFCVGLWMLDEYWYYSLFTLFMLIVFECTVVFQRLRTLNEFRTMSIKPFQIYAYRALKWVEISTTELLPGDIVSITRSKEDSATPCDLLLLSGSAIVNEAMLSGESTPLLKESVELREGRDLLDVNGSDRNNVVFGGTKVLQNSAPSDSHALKTPDGGAAGLVLRTGFGTTQGQLIRLMVFTNENRVTANNYESFFFIAFLLFFAIVASVYVWIKGNEMGRPKGKLLLDCVLIITSVVPPELPMELSMAVNASLMALSKYAIFCTEPFRIPFAGRVDICCFDKTGTITGEDLVVQGVAPAGAKGPENLKALPDTSKDTVLTLASAHALVLLEDGLVGDPMEKTTLNALDWKLSAGDQLSPANIREAKYKVQINIKRRFQFSSALKRMSTLSYVVDGGQRRMFAAVKGAPETLKPMYSSLPADYDETYKRFTRRGSRVLALGYKYLDGASSDVIVNSTREEVESGLQFAGFLVFHCPLKADAVESLKQLADASHRLVMITGDNPLTAVHVASEVEIVDRETLILDLREGAQSEQDLCWRNVEETTIIPVNPADPIDTTLFKKYDICMTGVALKQYESQPESWKHLVQNTWVYARVSPSQKEFILNSLKSLGYVTLMAGDGTNDVGALKAANIGIALLDGTPEDLQKIAQHQRNERQKKVYESQLSLTARFGQPPPPVPAALKELYPDLEKAREEVMSKLQVEKRNNPAARFDLASLTSQMEGLDDDGPPQIKLGDASVAAPFTSKLSLVGQVNQVLRQGRSTLVSMIQMHKILALNCLISAHSLSVLNFAGVKFGDYQYTIAGMMSSVCFLCISRAEVKPLSKERPPHRVLSLYMFSSVLLQSALHLASMIYITALVEKIEIPAEKVDIEAKFTPTLLNTAVYLLGLSQQVSTFAVNFIGRPWRESLFENKYMYYGLAGASGVAFASALDVFPELNEWLQIVPMEWDFRLRLVAVMFGDLAGCWLIETVAKILFRDGRPGSIITRGSERREARRKTEAAAAASQVEKAHP